MGWLALAVQVEMPILVAPDPLTAALGQDCVRKWQVSLRRFPAFLEEQQSRTQSFEFILGITIAETVSDKEQTALVSSTESIALLTRLDNSKTSPSLLFGVFRVYWCVHALEHMSRPQALS